MTVPNVSIIVPVYNVEKYLTRCINSLVTQTMSNIEIILVDDGSPDSCPSICDEAAFRDRRIKVIHKKNQGLGYARNSGLEVASGEYVYFVDSDDYLTRNAAEILYRAAKKDDADICFAGIYLENDNGERKESVPRYAGKTLCQPEITTMALKDMLGPKPQDKENISLRMSAWQGIYKRSWIEKYQLRFPSERTYISEDIIFHLDALPCADKMKYLSDCVYCHIADNPTSLTHCYNPDRFHKNCILYLEEKRRIGLIDNNSGMLERAQRTYLGNVRVCLKQIVQRSQSEGRGFADEEIRKIVDNDILQNVLKTYPYLKNPLKQAVMSFMLQHKMVALVRILTKVFLLSH